MSNRTDSLARKLQQSFRRHRRRPALSIGERVYSYGEVYRLSQRVRHALQRHKAPVHRPVVIDLEDPLLAICTMVAVLDSGRFYATLPKGISQDDRFQILDELDAAWIICHPLNTPGVKELIEPSLAICCLSGLRSKAAEAVSEKPLAAVYYTSGTTGRYKGVMITRATILRESARQIDRFSITPNDCFGLVFNPSFSASISAIYTGLLTGACVALFPSTEQKLHGKAVAEWLSRERVTLCDFTTTLFRHVCRALSQAPLPIALRMISAGAEKVTADDFARFRAIFDPPCQFQVTLASTETRVATELILEHCDEWPEGEGLPTGKPVGGARVTIYDDDGREMPLGKTGLISIRSESVAAGYWKDSELTAKFFQTHADSTSTFVSKDRGHLDDSGNLFFEGRTGDVINIRGMKISMSEVEDSLTRLWGLDVALVHLPESRGLLAFYDGDVLNKDKERALMRDAVNAMQPAAVPSALNHVKDFPRTPNGKIDRSQLSTIVDEQAHGEVAESSEARALCVFMRELLRCPTLTAGDSFFLRGGDSLSAAELLTWIDKSFGASLTIENVITNPSPNQLAHCLREQNTAPNFFTLQPSPKPGRLIFIPGMFGRVTPLIPIAIHLKEVISVYGVHYSKGFSLAPPGPTIQERAANLIASIPKESLSSPISLCGYSFGGLVAYEMAVQLTAAGVPVDSVWILDTACPLATAIPSKRKHRSVGRLLKEMGRTWRDPVGWLKLMRYRLRERLAQKNSLAWPNMDHRQQEKIAITRAVDSYEPSRSKLRLVLFLAKIDDGEGASNDEGWRKLTSGKVETVLCEGSHLEMLRPPYRASLIERILARF